ncbi:nuclear transport factor 2 family protein [Reinekea thalattae]|uniref:Nuclear transport factor 2 family protein n=1 Tax=Reinekea thalattae TaxID=2593301 RepID=A0A5C8Z4J1_9GAMM|nr:nuclear transport factor 2 family protein [Reinekea thalattae]TXR52143.1 nuclear transport factor 2 family protein [Reinekea thalattae]
MQQDSNFDEGLPNWLAQFLTTYESLNTSNLHLLKTIYSDTVEFQDPMHEIYGLKHLTAYFNKLYTNLKECRFHIDEVFYQNNNASVFWTMTYVHPKLNGGAEVTVQGHSHLKGQENLVYYHRDYLDVGAMLYEQIPLLGRIIKAIKGRSAS